MNKSVQEYVALRKAELKERIRHHIVGLCVIQVGDNSSSNSYIKGKIKDCEEVGIGLYHFHEKESETTESIVKLIEELNRCDYIHGIIVQLPLPPHIDVKKVQLAIDPNKDVDGFHPMSKFKPCTPMGVINFLKFNDYKFKGKNALVIGRSEIVGKPLAQLLTDLDCTVTLAHSKTNHVGYYMLNTDIIFTAIDNIEFYGLEAYSLLRWSDYIIDIGLGVSDRDHKLHGNLSEECVNYLKYRGDVAVLSGKGGVGLLTRLQLLENTVQASGL